LEVWEIYLPLNINIEKLFNFLQSEKGFIITNSYYDFDLNYNHFEMGAGEATLQYVLSIFKNIDIPKALLKTLLPLLFKFASSKIKESVSEIKKES